jgi:predicted secreted protein
VLIVSTREDRPGLVENSAVAWRATHRTAILRTVVITVALVGIAYLLTRHADHALQYLPLLVLLACPLMHIFMHRGHRH